MDYEIFEKKQTRVAHPAVTINPLGRIYFNQEASGWLAQHRVRRVLLLWYQDAWRVGIRRAKANDARAFALAYNNRGGGSSITAKSFLNWIGFRQDVGSLTVPAFLNEQNPLIEFQIAEEYLED